MNIGNDIVRCINCCCTRLNEDCVNIIMKDLIALMQRFGFSWLQSLSLAAFISLAVTAFAAWKVGRYFDYTGMHATRRQLSKLGRFDEDAAIDDDPPPAGTAHDPRAADHGGA